MKQMWLKKAGWLYLPIHAMGMLVTIGAIVLIAAVCIGVFKSGHTADEELYKVFINITYTAFW
jgi:hypothetical protein